MKLFKIFKLKERKMNSLFAHLEANLPTLKMLEQAAIGISATSPVNTTTVAAPNDPSVAIPANSPDQFLVAARSAWAFLVANAPELEAIADVIASAAGAPAAVPIINAVGAAIPGIGSVVDGLVSGQNTNSNSLLSGHANLMGLADSVSKLGAVVAQLSGAVGGNQEVTNVATEVSGVAATIAQTASTDAQNLQASSQVTANPVAGTA